MNKKIYIVLTFLFMVIILTGSLLSLTACGTVYHSKSGTKEQMAGTYKLTTYIQKDTDNNDVDRIEQLDVKAYMIINADGHGYYVYQDKDTDFWYDSIFIDFTRDDEKDELYKSIQITTGGDERITIDKQKPGCGYEPIMGFDSEEKTFNYFIPKRESTNPSIRPSYYTDVVYTKISEDTSLSTVSNEVGKTLSPLIRYELKNLHGFLVLTANESKIPTVTNDMYNIYKYYVVDFDALNNTATIYYEKIEGSAGPQKETVTPEVKFVPRENDDSIQIVIKFSDKEFCSMLNTRRIPPRELYYSVWTEKDENGNYDSIYTNYLNHRSTSKTLDEFLQEQLDKYNGVSN